MLIAKCTDFAGTKIKAMQVEHDEKLRECEQRIFDAEAAHERHVEELQAQVLHYHDLAMKAVGGGTAGAGGGTTRVGGGTTRVGGGTTRVGGGATRAGGGTAGVGGGKNAKQAERLKIPVLSTASGAGGQLWRSLPQ